MPPSGPGPGVQYAPFEQDVDVVARGDRIDVDDEVDDIRVAEHALEVEIDVAASERGQLGDPGQVVVEVQTLDEIDGDRDRDGTDRAQRHSMSRMFVTTGKAARRVPGSHAAPAR